MAARSIQFKTRVHHDDDMVRDHLVHGVRILPGVFLLDMLYRLGPQIGFEADAMELRRCLFLEPIAVTDAQDKEVRIRIEIESAVATVTAESRSAGTPGGGEHPSSRVFTCEIHRADPAEPRRRIDVGALQGAARVADADALYAFARQVNIQHFDFMKASGRIYQGDDYLLAQVSLSEIARGHLDHFHVHPTYLDFSTLMPFSLLDVAQAGDTPQPFIPIFIESFRAYGRLGGSCWVYVGRRADLSLSQDLVRSDLELFGPDGTLLVHFQGFTAKKIRAKELITRLAGERGAAALVEREGPPAREPAEPPPPTSSPAGAGGPAQATAAREIIQQDLRSMLAELLDRPAADIAIDQGFYELGLSSVDLLQAVQRLERKLERQLYPTLLFEHSTVAELTRYLEEHFGAAYLKEQNGAAGPARALTASDGGAARAEATEAPVTVARSAGGGRTRRDREDEIAIVGVAGRYPMANDVDAFWANLREGRDCITEIPPSRWDHRRYFDPERGKPGRCYSRWGGFIEGHDEFDPLFFNISPREAEMMDPHERLFLQIVWETLEDAGYTRERLAACERKIGVFAGVMWSDYQLFGLEEALKGNPVVAGSWFSSVANRASYFFDFHGPSMPVDTACSSALYAIHLACESIKRGECRAAIAGGVNLSLHPSKYCKLSELQMLSNDGRCRSFGEGGTGYVPGEGVGAVLLRPLSDAVEAGDSIHAIIKASAVSHGGRTGGFSVPSPDAQARLITEALERAGVDPATLGYVEAHGTGTSLGDPIEVAGLTAAFRGVEQRGLCAIGSVKSNIGHLEAAAGIAGLTKVLLCMKHRTLVPSLHAQEVNRNIDLARTPFFIPQIARPWERPRLRIGGVDVELPRRAGLSSFGAGGANAHLVLEEYVAPGEDPPSDAPGREELILLSARNEDRLRARAEDLREILARTPGARLEDIAYTLQVGREAMEARLAVVVRSKEELSRALGEYLAGREGKPAVLRGQVRRSEGMGADPEDQAYVRRIWDAGRLAKLAVLWTDGASIDPAVFEGNRRRRRISLPTYPFARRRCWIPQGGAARAPGAPAPASQALHPLLDANASTLEAYRFSKRFTGDEFFLTDHLIQGRRVLPGVVSLEMARAAVSLLAQAEVSALEQITWARPLAVGDAPVDVVLRLRPSGDRVGFEIASGAGPEPTLHARGVAALGGAGALSHAARPSVAEIRGRCGEAMEADDVYRALADRDLRYGPGLRVIRRLFVGEGEALAELELPEHLRGDFEAYGLHPALLDGALQAVVGLIRREGAGADPALPFSVGAVRALGRPTPRGYAHVVVASSSARPGGALCFHVDLLDEAGQPVVLLRDFTVRAAPREARRQEETPRAHEGPLFYRPAWVGTAPLTPFRPAGDAARRALLILNRGEALAAAIGRRLRDLTGAAPPVILVEAGAEFRREGSDRVRIDPASPDHYRQVLADLEGRGLTLGGVIHLWGARPEEPSPGAAARPGAMISEVFLLARALLASKPREPTPILVAAHGDEASPELAAVAGLARSLRLESPRVPVKVLHLAAALRGSPAEPDLLLAELQQPGDVEARLGPEGRGVRVFEGVAPPAPREGDPPLLRRGGAYLITGGAGGLGLLFARYLAREVGARLVLAGRSPLDARREEALQELAALGGEALYVQADVADAADAARCVALSIERFGALHGVLHAAGVIEDALAVNKGLESFERVLSPKVQGTIHLDQATAYLPLDFVILFSSVSAALGSIGQTDYAAGNGFMDAFAAHRERLRGCGQRHGRTISINWPLWREGGMQIRPEVEGSILEAAGLRVLETDRGLAAFAAALALDGPQIMVLEGDPARIARRIDLASRGASPPPQAEAAEAAGAGDAEPGASRRAAPDAGGREIEAQALREITAMCAEVLKVPEGEIDPEIDFSDYGMDSLMVMRLLDHVEGKYQRSLDPSAIAEHSSVLRLARFLIAEGLATPRTGLPAPAAAPAAAPLAEAAPAQREAGAAALPPPPPSAAAWAAAAPSEGTKRPGEIAVIAMACRFPRSATVEVYWDHLAAGRDVMSPVPPDRWDAARYYSPRKGEPYKTCATSGGFIEGIDLFDPGFFGLSDAEAAWLDPQQRIVLELCQELLDRAGYAREEVKGTRTGVFIGGTANEYVKGSYLHQPRSTPELVLTTLQNMIAARVSHFYDLKGPSMTVDTACSSSLVAIHQACRSLLSGESELAIAGGVHLLLDPFIFIALNQAEMLSDDGRMRIFDRSASGMSLGEGAGLVLLKEHGRALRDGDLILGTILGSAVNNDGRTLSVMTPSKEAQVAVIERALASSGVSPEVIGYLETHGSGNAFGDPIEIHAAAEAYRRHTARRQYCGVGSVKSNMGALLHAGGAASFIKVMLALERRILPATVHCRDPHPRFRFQETPFYPVTAARPWEPIGGRRVAAISSFGLGGTNCHLIAAEVDEERADGRAVRRPLPPTRFARRPLWLARPGAAPPGGEAGRAAPSESREDGARSGGARADERWIADV